MKLQAAALIAVRPEKVKPQIVALITATIVGEGRESDCVLVFFNVNINTIQIGFFGCNINNMSLRVVLSE